MIETHGWISIALSTDGEGEDDLVNAIRPLSAMIARINSSQNIINIRPLNGRYFVTILSHPNHKGEDFKDIMTLINYIASFYRGSYGLIYIRNDEDCYGNDNNFVVYKLIRGKVFIEKDFYLSPCSPIIED